jgi:hypothetical protein
VAPETAAFTSSGKLGQQFLFYVMFRGKSRQSLPPATFYPLFSAA